MRYLSLVSIFFSLSAFADTPKVELIESRIAGGAFDRSPAVAAMEESIKQSKAERQCRWNGICAEYDNFIFSALRIEIMGSVGAFLDGYQLFRDYKIFADQIKEDYNNQSYSIIPTRAEELAGVFRRSNKYGFLKSYGELVRVEYRDENTGVIYGGLFWQSDAGLKVTAPPPENIKLVVDPVMGAYYIDVGEARKIAEASGFGDGGLFFGYGKNFRLAEQFDLAFGVDMRFFYRFNIPEHTVFLDSRIDGDKGITYPDGFDYSEYLGLNGSVSAAFGLNDGYFDSKIFVEVYNIRHLWGLGTATGYAEDAAVSFGVSGAPFKYLENDDLRVAFEIEQVNDHPIVELGLRYLLGDDAIYFMPGVGMRVETKEILGTKRRLFTCGFDSKLWDIGGLAALFEYDADLKTYNVGVSLKVASF